VFLRCWAVAQRPFWMDEAWVANAAVNLSYKELFFQTQLPIPPLFGLVVKLTGTLPGPAEFSMRLVPMLSGIGCVILSYLILRTLRVPRFTSLVGMAFCASSPMLVIWSRELKQYEVEALLSMLLALLIFKIRQSRSSRAWWGCTIAAVAVCLFGPWIGYGFLFAGAALMGAMVLLRPIRGYRRGTAVVGLVGLAVLICSSFLLLRVAASQQASQQGLVDFTQRWFVDITRFRSWARAGAYGLSCSVMMFSAFEILYRSVLNSALCGTGIWVLVLLGLWGWPVRGRKEMCFWVIGPWVLLLAASILGKYPFGSHRMMVFLAGPMVLAVSLGLVVLLRFWSALLKGRSGIGVVLALTAALLTTMSIVKVPFEDGYWVRHDFPTVLAVLGQKQDKGELVFVSLDAGPPVRYYAGKAGKDFTFLPGCAGTLAVSGYDYEKFIRESLTNTNRNCWILTTSFESGWGQKELMEVIRDEGYRVELVTEAGGDNVYGAAQLFSATLRRK